MKTTLFLLALSTALSLTAIAQKDDIHDQAGKIRDYSGKEGPPNLLNNNGLDASSLNGLNAASLKLIGIAESCPELKQPMGFDLRVQVSVAKPSPYAWPLQQALTVNNWLAMHEFYKGENGSLEVNAETGAGFHLTINELLNLFPGEFNGECDQLRLPRFFTLRVFGIRETTPDYLLLNDGRRVITNGNPIYIPYTREQYLQFQIKTQEKKLRSGQKDLDDFKAMKARAAAANNAAMQASVDKGIAGIEQAMAATQQQLATMNAQLAAMSMEEKRSPAFMDVAGNSMALFTPNPGYFNPQLPKAGVQLITVIRTVDTRFVSKYYADIADRVMECIDYKKLKEMIQK